LTNKGKPCKYPLGNFNEEEVDEEEGRKEGEREEGVEIRRACSRARSTQRMGVAFRTSSVALSEGGGREGGREDERV